MSSKFKPPSIEDVESVQNYIAEETPRSSKEFGKREQSSDEKSTTLYNGEKVSKNDKILSCIGTLEELLSYIGIIKAEYFSEEENELDVLSSEKLFIFARLTQIQESLIDIMASIGTSKKVNARYENTRFSNRKLLKELEDEINSKEINYKVKDKPLQIIPGTNKLQAELLYSRAITRRAERQLYGLKNLIAPDKLACEYLNKLGDYFLSLSLYILQIGFREPLKKASKQKRQPNLK